MGQTVTRFAVFRPRTLREKHHHFTNSHLIRSPFCAEEFQTPKRSPASFQRWFKFDADTTAILFAEHSRKPSFSLGLQSLLELLLHKIRVPRVSHGVHETDAVRQKQLNQAIVYCMHAVRTSDLH